ncbi:hypothetical protein [Kitasatospora sp. NPDC093679]|uniref:hypothetical protein n=1 Tax=Kitasatospora sp. NPDC093679 TaxID=3154983 RepID=UPI003420C982
MRSTYMTRHQSRVAAASAFIGLLALSGCASGNSKGSDDITGAQSAPPSTSAPSASTSPGWTAPAFDLPSDVTVKLDGFTASDPAKNEVLRDLGYAMTAYEEGLATGKTDRPALVRYYFGLAGGAVSKSIIDYKAGGNRITGTSHFLKPQVTLNDAASAVADLCEDQTASFAKDLKTGAVKTTSPSADDYVAWHLTAKKNAKGDWQVDNAEWVHGAGRCQP